MVKAHYLFKILDEIELWLEFELFEEKVPINFLGTWGFSAHGDARYFRIRERESREYYQGRMKSESTSSAPKTGFLRVLQKWPLEGSRNSFLRKHGTLYGNQYTPKTLVKSHHSESAGISHLVTKI